MLPGIEFGKNTEQLKSSVFLPNSFLPMLLLLFPFSFFSPSSLLLFPLSFLHPSCSSKLLVNDPLELSIHAAKFISGPFFKQLIYLCIQSEYEIFLICHNGLFLDQIVNFTGIKSRYLKWESPLFLRKAPPSNY